ncbi:PAS domain-containing hybrid sensor histidine kinase/response regulator [Urbifossiella limnaea]|uniref:PAS domain-containing hybrid sensor histidine kinase/response regulator n=1 Tax=Urbifossiella limnaea TaxID=2528023 RepID=UPI00119F383E|nr:PAS domain-containing hybrid sensor histidine kinase/response regulator [Urbifossiella limnaea]
MNTPHPDERLQRALDKFLTRGGPFVLPEGPPPTALLPAPPGGLPPDTKLNAALPTPAVIPRPAPREPSPTPIPGASRAVVTTDAVLAGLDHVVWSVSPDGALVYLLGGPVERLFGHPAEFFLDKSDGWLSALPDDDADRLRAAFAGLSAAGSFVVEHTAGGRRVVTRGRLLLRPDGRPIRVDGSTTELTETATERELRAKLAVAEEALRATARLGTLGRLVSGVAHDFNNCLTVVSGNAELLRELLPADDPLRDTAGEIVAHVASAALVARQLVAFGKPTGACSGPTDPANEIRVLDRLLRRLTGEDITLDVLLAPGVPPIPVGAGSLAQVVLNLVANARDAIPRHGTVTLRVAEAVVDRAREGWPEGLPAGRYVALTVADTGVGMTEAVRARMFDPYFTTKGPAGNGVGLATVAEIVRTAGGHIEVESAAGWGTSVRVFFPPADYPPAVVPPTAPEAPPRPATVLLVQDATRVRDLAASALQHAGYRVLEADDGVAGEERARLYAGPIDLLVTDVGLPKQDGRELASALRAARPGLRVLFASGSAAEVPGPLLPKPYTPAELLAAVRLLLDG